MARTKAYLPMTERTHQNITEVLRDQARRKLTPEQAAHELGVTVSSLRRYLADAGGRIGRTVYMPD